MRHLTEEDLVLHYYGEHEDAAAVAAHFEACTECRASLAALRADLDDLVFEAPTPGPDYGTRVWERLRPRLASRAGAPARSGGAVRRPAALLALAASLVAAFLLGRLLPRSPEGAAGDARERILLAAVARHLDRSQRVLVELAHAEEGGAADLPERAERLVAENRLYRGSAERAGEIGLASLLDDLGRVLMEVAHAREPLTHADVRELNERVERKALLFKVRVVGSRLSRPQPPRGGSGSSL